MADDLQRMEATPGNLYNFHPGSHVGQGTEAGITMIADMLNGLLRPEQTTTVLLETMAGKGSEVGGRFEELREILDRVTLKEKMGVCLDTCHVHDAGYDIVNHPDEVLAEFLSSEQSYKRKIQEAYLALQLETKYSKDEILETYLNTIYLGESYYGIKVAAKGFFGKELEELSLRECAMLAGVTNNPYYYNRPCSFHHRKAPAPALWPARSCRRRWGPGTGRSPGGGSGPGCRRGCAGWLRTPSGPLHPARSRADEAYPPGGAAFPVLLPSGGQRGYRSSGR